MSSLFGFKDTGVRELKRSDIHGIRIINFAFKYKRGLLIIYNSDEESKDSLKQLKSLGIKMAKWRGKSFPIGAINSKKWPDLVKRFQSKLELPVFLFIKKSGLPRLWPSGLNIQDIPATPNPNSNPNSKQNKIIKESYEQTILDSNIPSEVPDLTNLIQWCEKLIIEDQKDLEEIAAVKIIKNNQKKLKRAEYKIKRTQCEKKELLEKMENQRQSKRAARERKRIRKQEQKQKQKQIELNTNKESILDLNTLQIRYKNKRFLDPANIKIIINTNDDTNNNTNNTNDTNDTTIIPLNDPDLKFVINGSDKYIWGNVREIPNPSSKRGKRDNVTQHFIEKNQIYVPPKPI